MIAKIPVGVQTACLRFERGMVLFSEQSNPGPATDLRCLWPTDVSINANRASKDFDFGDAPEGEAPDTFIDNDSWQPRDDAKGEVARTMFYMVVRYEGGPEPDLELVDFTGTSNTQFGKLCTILDWHNGDPVSDTERRRNEIIFQKQGNRNPFVDRPEWIAAI